MSDQDRSVLLVDGLITVHLSWLPLISEHNATVWLAQTYAEATQALASLGNPDLIVMGDTIAARDVDDWEHAEEVSSDHQDQRRSLRSLIELARSSHPSSTLLIVRRDQTADSWTNLPEGVKFIQRDDPLLPEAVMRALQEK